MEDIAFVVTAGQSCIRHSAHAAAVCNGALVVNLAARRRQQMQLGVMMMSAQAAAAASGKACALIFDCDGVILESESLHREAYNQVFREFDVAYQWSEEYYDELQNKVGGGKPKMRYYFSTYGWPESKLGSAPTDDVDAQTTLIDELQDRKTEIYKEFISTGTAKQRPGILRLMDEAIANKERMNLRLAICSASTKRATR